MRAPVLLFVLVAICQPSGASPPASPDLTETRGPPAPDLVPPPVAVAACDSPLGGVSLPAELTEARPGFAEELKALDLSRLLARIDLKPVTGLVRGLLACLLVLDPGRLGEELDRDAALSRGRSGAWWWGPSP